MAERVHELQQKELGMDLTKEEVAEKVKLVTDVTMRRLKLSIRNRKHRQNEEDARENHRRV